MEWPVSVDAASVSGAAAGAVPTPLVAAVPSGTELTPVVAAVAGPAPVFDPVVVAVAEPAAVFDPVVVVPGLTGTDVPDWPGSLDAASLDATSLDAASLADGELTGASAAWKLGELVTGGL